jgi:hypothetical protein
MTLTQEVNVKKLFFYFSLTKKSKKYNCAFVPGKPFQACLTCTVKAASVAVTKKKS